MLSRQLPITFFAWSLGLLFSNPCLAQIQGHNQASTSLGTAVNGQIGGSCLSGSCIITGGVTAGSNTFHRFDFFTADTLKGISSVTFDGSIINGTIFASVLSGITTLNSPLSLTNNGSIVFLSPNGISVGSAFSLDNVTNLVLSTAQSLKLAEDKIFYFDTTSASELSSLTDLFPYNPLIISSALGDKTSSNISLIGGSSSIDSVNIFVHQSLYVDTLGDIDISNAYITSDPFLSGSSDSFAYFSSGGVITIDPLSTLMLSSYTTPSLFYSIDNPNPSPASPELQISASSFIAADTSDNYTVFSNPTYKVVAEKPLEEPPAAPTSDPPADTPTDTNATNTDNTNLDTTDTTYEETTPTPIDDTASDPNSDSQPDPEPPLSSLNTDEDNTGTDPQVDPSSADQPPDDTPTPESITASSDQDDSTSDLAEVSLTPLTTTFTPTSESSPLNESLSAESSQTTESTDETDDNLSSEAPNNLSSSPPSSLATTSPSTSTPSPTPVRLTTITPTVSLSLPRLTQSFSMNTDAQTNDAITTLGLPSSLQQSGMNSTQQYQSLLQSVFQQLNGQASR